MPEMTFSVAWPDGRQQECYSPSLVVHDYLTAGLSYPVQDFVDRSAEALDLAAQRVQARFGFTCTSAAAQRDQIRVLAQQYPDGGEVRILSMEPSLPTEQNTPPEKAGQA